MISNMVAEPRQDLLGHLLSGFRYRITHHLYPRTKPNSVGHEGGVLKSPTSVERWPEQVLKSGGNPHLTGRFCGVVLVPTTNSKLVMQGNLHDISMTSTSYHLKFI